MAKGVKMSLADFQSVPATASWADDVEEDLPQAPAAAKIEYDYKTSESSTRQSARPASRDIPSHPPFIAFVGQLSYETKPEQIDAYFRLLDLKDIKIVTDSEKRSKGFAYVTFATQEALKGALLLDNGMIDGRAVRIDVGENTHSEERATNVSDGISDWRARATPGQVSAFGQQREQRPQTDKQEYVSQNASYLALQKQVPTERTRIIPTARTAPPKVIQVFQAEPILLQRQDSNKTLIVEEREEREKPNPFGAARPRDEAEIARASAARMLEREEKDRLAKEAKRVEDIRVRALALAEKQATPVVAIKEEVKEVEKKMSVLTVADTQTNWRSRPKPTTTATTPETTTDAAPRYTAKRTTTSVYDPTVKSDRMSKFGGKDVRPVYLKKEVVKLAAVNTFDVLGDC